MTLVALSHTTIFIFIIKKKTNTFLLASYFNLSFHKAFIIPFYNSLYIYPSYNKIRSIPDNKSNSFLRRRREGDPKPKRTKKLSKRSSRDDRTRLRFKLH